MEQALDRCRGVVFDFDGTLFDLNVDWFELRVALDRRFPMAEFGSIGVRTGLDKVERDYGPEGLCSAMEIVRRHEAAGSFNARPASVALAQEAKALGKRLGVFSANSRATLTRALEAHGLISVFEVVVGAEDAPRRKPHPDGLLLAIEALGLRPKETIYIADGPDEASTAAIAGVLQFFHANCVD